MANLFDNPENWVAYNNSLSPEGPPTALWDPVLWRFTLPAVNPASANPMSLRWNSAFTGSDDVKGFWSSAAADLVWLNDSHGTGPGTIAFDSGLDSVVEFSNPVSIGGGVVVEVGTKGTFNGTSALGYIYPLKAFDYTLPTPIEPGTNSPQFSTPDVSPMALMNDTQQGFCSYEVNFGDLPLSIDVEWDSFTFPPTFTITTTSETPPGNYFFVYEFLYDAGESGVMGANGTVNFTVGAAPVVDTLNCDCNDGTAGHQTLAQLRKRLMLRLGYAAQANNPPPGMRDLLNDFLYTAQTLLAQRLDELGVVRFFTWPLLAGKKLYDLPLNAEACPVKIDPRHVRWAGVEIDGIWRPLAYRIPPELYTHSEVTSIWPTRYEIRECIEIWPVPVADGGRLVLKGSFGMRRFTEDTDPTTLDSELVFLQALADAQMHYRKPAAQKTQQQVEVLLRDIVAGTHVTARYIPGRSPALDATFDYPVATPPFGTPGSPL